jgi:hypothetical protein
MAPVPWKLWEGQVVDLYFPLHRYLGGTDRSAVYLTHYGDPLPRNAAIKLTLADAPEADPTANWERAAQLSHPHLLPLWRTGKCEVNQIPLRYAVTEYAEENLAGVLAERALTGEEVRQMLEPLLGAVAYIHAEGLVHGHLKPANIMAIGDDLKLAVDGVSLVGEPGAALSAAGPYDPPEFRDRGCSPLGDVWSVGVTLVECLTQRLPALSGPKQELVLPPGIPAEFLAMIRACLRPDPRRRPWLNEILDLYGREEPKVVEEPAPPGRAASTKWLGIGLVAASAVALAGILAGPRTVRQPAAPQQNQQPAALPVSTTENPKPVTLPAVEPAPATVIAAAAPPPAPPAPPARSTVEAAPGQVVHQVLPDIPEYARRTIRGKVKIDVRATVDADGHVNAARVTSQNSRYFAKLTEEAARKWEFAPASGDWLLRFEFTTAETTVKPSLLAK